MTDLGRLHAAVSAAPRASVVVAGDLMLDRYLRGDVQRISPEAPVPVLRLRSEQEAAGGAANVALNLVGLGLDVEAAGFIGDDAEGQRVRALLEARGVGTSALVTVAGWRTTTKTRAMGGHQQLLRIDREQPMNGHERATRDMQASAARVLGRGAKALLLSDYDKGALTSSTCKALVSAAQAAGALVVVDPKGSDYEKYRGALTISPNHKELAQVAGCSPDDPDALLGAGREMVRKLGLAFLTLTQGERGISIVHSDRVEHVPAIAQEVFDVSGAGDTVIAMLTMALLAGLDAHDAVHLANVAAGIVVGKVGTVFIDKDELLSALAPLPSYASSDAKRLDRQAATRQVAHWRALGQTVAFTNGCFDLLHVGHVTSLERARGHADHLVVGLNADASVRRLKGAGRPVTSELQRARVLASLACVDAVVLFEEDTPLQLICAVKPDVLVKGADYSLEQVVGGKEAAAWGGRVVLVPLVEGLSTTARECVQQAANEGYLIEEPG